MKTALALALALMLPLRADETEDTQLIHFDMLIVSLPEAQAVALRPDLQDPKKIAAAQEKLLALVAKKEAELVGWPTLTTRSGNRAVVETIHELRFPIEFENSGLTVNLSPGSEPIAVTPENASKAPEYPEIKANLTGTAAVPTTFETRNIGVTLELEPVVRADGVTVDIQLAPNRTQLLGFRKIPIEQDEGKIKSMVEQPEIFTTKMTTNLIIKSGDYTLLGFHKAAKPEGNVEITILKTVVEVFPAEKPENKTEPAKK